MRWVLRGCLPGLAPAGHLPFCFAKKVGQKGALLTSIPTLTLHLAACKLLGFARRDACVAKPRAHPLCKGRELFHTESAQVDRWDCYLCA